MARGKYISPTINATAFSCPHCGTLTKQVWYPFKSAAADGSLRVWTQAALENLKSKKDIKDMSDDFWEMMDRQVAGFPVVRKIEWESINSIIHNVMASRCDECDEVAVWVYDAMIWPSQNDAPEPNADLPSDIARDYSEAGDILSKSPRGAAALLRLCVQKLCGHLLGEVGSSIDKDIASLVARGLDVRVQRALDIVRVVGNEAVHPGTMDISDDRATAEELFRLVNLIADIMISQPKHIEAVYETLPEEKRKAIERRDAPKLLAASPKLEGE